MFFSLEALQAHQGDCLVLSWGKSKDKIRHIVIDGGPSGVFKQSLSMRLAELRTAHDLEAEDPLPLEMVMVSHIDDDHINGVLDLFSAIEHGGDTPLYKVKTLWFNSFDDVLGNSSQELKSRLASLGDSVEKGAVTSDRFREGEGGRHSAAVLASVGQGRQLRSKAQGLKVILNAGFKGLVMQQGKPAVSPQADGLQFHILAPSLERLNALNEAWDTDVKTHPSDGAVAAFTDKSVANLSSIAVVAKFGGRTMLLTGDGRGDDILDGLKAAGFIDNAKTGKCHVDVLKMPHHGSSRDMTQDFLERITADHYVISADGKFDNPDKETMEMLVKARRGESYQIHMTNKAMVNPKNNRDVGAEVTEVLQGAGALKQAIFRKEDALGVRVDLFDELPF